MDKKIKRAPIELLVLLVIGLVIVIKSTRESEKPLLTKQENKDGTTTLTSWWWEGAKREEITYIDKIMHGSYKYWWSSFAKGKQGPIMVEKHYKNGKEDGFEYNYTSKGKIEQVTRWREGKPLYTQGFDAIDESNTSIFRYNANSKIEGPSTRWHEGYWKENTYVSMNQKKEEGNWINGKHNGLWNYWYRNGQMKEQGNWVMGKKDGIWMKWNEAGTKKTFITYKVGMVVSDNNQS